MTIPDRKLQRKKQTTQKQRNSSKSVKKQLYTAQIKSKATPIVAVTESRKGVLRKIDWRKLLPIILVIGIALIVLLSGKIGYNKGFTKGKQQGRILAQQEISQIQQDHNADLGEEYQRGFAAGKQEALKELNGDVISNDTSGVNNPMSDLENTLEQQTGASMFDNGEKVTKQHGE